MSPLDPELPPVGEEVHLPGPSLLPFLLAVGVMLGVIGVTLGKAFWIPGVIITLITAAVWIRDSRHEMGELPVEHRDH